LVVAAAVPHLLFGQLRGAAGDLRFGVLELDDGESEKVLVGRLHESDSTARWLF
jgi:hypothetical protein